MIKKRMFKNMEWWIVVCAFILCGIGLVALFSATQSTEYDDFKKQIVWLIVGTIIMLVVACIDYEFLLKLSPVFYRHIYYNANNSIIY